MSSLVDRIFKDALNRLREERNTELDSWFLSIKSSFVDRKYKDCIEDLKALTKLVDILKDEQAD